MRIDKLIFTKKIRCIQEGTEIDFRGTENYCALVGLNGSGKTSVIDYLFGSIKNLKYKGSPIWKKIIIGDVCFKDDEILPKLPKSVIYNYSGDSKTGTTGIQQSGTYLLKFDYRVWSIACLVFQVINDPIIERYGLRNELVEEKILEAKLCYNNCQKEEKEYRVMSKIFETVVGLTRENHKSKLYEIFFF